MVGFQVADRKVRDIKHCTIYAQFWAQFTHIQERFIVTQFGLSVQIFELQYETKCKL